MTRPIIIDTDPGIDDALAIMLAAASPEVELLGLVSVAGNVGLDHTSANAAALADLLQLDCPVGRGASGPLWRRDTLPADEVHGANGFAGYELPASKRPLEPGVPLLARLVEQSETPVTIVAIGPLTNIALFINEYPEAAQQVERIVIMGGGTLDRLGNATPAAEFNIYYDPDAAAVVFGSGLPITMVGLNVTERALVGRQHLTDLFASGGSIADMVAHLVDGYVSEATEEGMAQHDSVALAAALDPSLITSQHVHVDVENTGRLTSGMTVVDFGGYSGKAPNCDVGLTVDVERFRALLNERLTQLDQRISAS